MRILWTFLKVIIGLAVAIPLGILALALTAGFVGTLFALTILAVKLACIGLVGYGVIRIARAVFAPSAKSTLPPLREIPRADPYYDAAMRELDTELRG